MAELAPLKTGGAVLHHETEAKAVFAQIDADGSGTLVSR